MGADLYIPKLHEPARKEWEPVFYAAVKERDAATDETAKAEAQKKVSDAYDKMNAPEGYFRDSYNGTSVAWRLGISWWKDLTYDVKYVEGNPATEINVSAEACRKFRDMVAAAKLKPCTVAELRKYHCNVDDGENSPEAWDRYFAEKRDRLIAFLDRAIEHGGMYASC